MARSEGDNPARPPAGLRLCALDEIKDPGGKSFRFRDGSCMFAGFVLRQGDQARGFVDSCPHAGWPLAPMDDRYLTRDARHILCAGHGALFTLEGLCVAGPCADERLTDWPVEVRDGEVFTA
ncbi:MULTISPECIES: Rieske 2Fe-2S domain-containing protein [unclassified Phenylobacterium]|uniref:Rieske (2Fe-2S) protein n=1 Tax=unclassified Phenylobacterium TaxID=2640670 RepID=UPI00083A83F6|nr:MULTISPECIES: Rieske 2Fe-2S domain-containing protein [unclassified Phenylobacterium]